MSLQLQYRSDGLSFGALTFRGDPTLPEEVCRGLSCNSEYKYTMGGQYFRPFLLLMGHRYTQLRVESIGYNFFPHP